MDVKNAKMGWGEGGGGGRGRLTSDVSALYPLLEYWNMEYGMPYALEKMEIANLVLQPLKHFISNTAIPLAHNPLTLWSCKIMWQMKTIISPLPQCLWLPNLVGWWLNLRGSYPSSHMTLWSCGLMRSHDKLETCLHYHNSYGYQTWWDGGIQCGASTSKLHDPLVTWSCGITWQTKTNIP